MGAGAADVSIRTVGIAFAEGDTIEPIFQTGQPNRLTLLHWDGAHATIGPRITRGRRIYEPDAIDPSIVHALRLPTGTSPYGSIRQLTTDICRTISSYTQLNEKKALLVSSFVIATWLDANLPDALWLSIYGPDTVATTQLLKLLHGICRHALMLSVVSVTALCRLPLPFGLTLLLHQPELGSDIERVLFAAHHRHEYVAQGGRVFDVHCPIVTCSILPSAIPARVLSRVEIPIPPSLCSSPMLGPNELDRIAEDLQPRLLAYRLENYRKVLSLQFEPLMVPWPTRELGRTLGACALDDTDLQAEIVKCLHEEHAELRAASWADSDVVVVEALLFHCQPSRSSCDGLGSTRRRETEKVTD